MAVNRRWGVTGQTWQLSERLAAMWSAVKPALSSVDQSRPLGAHLQLWHCHHNQRFRVCSLWLQKLVEAGIDTDDVGPAACGRS